MAHIFGGAIFPPPKIGLHFMTADPIMLNSSYKRHLKKPPPRKGYNKGKSVKNNGCINTHTHMLVHIVLAGKRWKVNVSQ